MSHVPEALPRDPEEPTSERRPRATPPEAATPDPASARLTSNDGATATLKDGALELRDAHGRLLVRYSDGHAEIAAPSGDLVLSAPSGRVVVSSSSDITLEAKRDVKIQAERKWAVVIGEATAPPRLEVGRKSTEVRSERLLVETDTSRLVTRRAAVLARVVTTTAEQIVTRAEQIDRSATRVVERARDMFHEVADLYQSNVGRARTLVRDVYSLRSRRTTMDSAEDTSIDGKRVLLG